MSSLNTGLGEFFSGIFNSNGTKNQVSHRIVFAHVLDVVEDEFSPWYQGPDSIGAVRARILMTGYNKYEDEQDTLLYPLDRTYMRVPFPGEQVIGMVSFGPAEQGTYLMRYYYWKILTADQNITYSGNPFTGTDPYHIAPGLKAMVDVSAESKRFDNKLPYDKALLQNKSVNQRVRLGERTIESRFGAMIKFTSTPTDSSTWDESQVNNLSTPPVMSVGDPLVIIGAHPKTSTSTELTTRDLDVNASSNIFLASTQNLPTKLGCSTKLSTFNVDLRLGDLQSATDETATLQTIYGGGYDPTAQLGIALTGTIKLPGGGGNGESTNPDEMCGASTNTVDTTYPRTVKFRGTAPVKIQPMNAPTVTVNLGAQPEVVFSRTIVSPQAYIAEAEKVINMMIPNASKSDKLVVLKSAFVISRTEQGSGDGFKGFNNNLSGVESSGFQVYNAADVNGKVGATEGGTGKKKYYYSFSNVAAGLVPLISKVIERNMFDGGGGPNEWAWRSYRDWNGYGARTKTTYVSDCVDVQGRERVYVRESAVVDQYTTFK